MRIKNKDDFNTLREEIKKGQAATSNKIKLFVGLGTCGAAAGANEVWNSLESIIKKEKLVEVELVKVGCVGCCYAEPTVEVLYPDGHQLIIGYLNKENAREVVDLHIKKRTPDHDKILKVAVSTKYDMNRGKQ